MALVGPNGRFQFGGECEGEILRPTEKCFYCCERLSGDYFIFWDGGDEKDQQIWLHPGCVQDLCKNLAGDLHQWRIITGVFTK